jgi:hypothetical protein
MVYSYNNKPKEKYPVKSYRFLILILILIAAACTSTEENDQADLDADSLLPTEMDVTRSASQDQGQQITTSGPDCYSDGVHPIGESISEQFNTITTYEEVMAWFCNGASFEDILNALMTEEITNVDAESTLYMVAEGYTWDEIWLELGVTEE